MESYQTNHTQPADATSMLQFLNPKEDIDDILYLLLGLQKKNKLIAGTNTRQIVYERVNKPIFSDEYSRSISADLRSFLNYTVQVSRFDNVEIRKKVGNYLKKLLRSFATHGDDAYISTNTWRKMIDIYESETDTNGTFIGWKKFGINWSYNDPVGSEMIDKIKDLDEEMDQSVIFDKLISTFGSIIHASFNKSFSPHPETAGMLLGSMTQIRSESQVIRDAEKKSWTGNVFGRGNE